MAIKRGSKIARVATVWSERSRALRSAAADLRKTTKTKKKSVVKTAVKKVKAPVKKSKASLLNIKKNFQLWVWVIKKALKKRKPKTTSTTPSSGAVRKAVTIKGMDRSGRINKTTWELRKATKKKPLTSTQKAKIKKAATKKLKK